MDAEKEVVSQLGVLQLDKLKLVYTELKLAEITDNNKKDNESYIRRMIMRHLSSDTIGEAEDEGLATFLHLSTFIKDMIKTEDPKELEDGENYVEKDKTQVDTEAVNREVERKVKQAAAEKKESSTCSH